MKKYGYFVLNERFLGFIISSEELRNQNVYYQSTFLG